MNKLLFLILVLFSVNCFASEYWWEETEAEMQNDKIIQQNEEILSNQSTLMSKLDDQQKDN